MVPATAQGYRRSGAHLARQNTKTRGVKTVAGVDWEAVTVFVVCVSVAIVGVLETPPPEAEPQYPDVKVRSLNEGNAIQIVAHVAEALRQAGYETASGDWTTAAWNAGSYDQLVAMADQWVAVDDSPN